MCHHKSLLHLFQTDNSGQGHSLPLIMITSVTYSALITLLVETAITIQDLTIVDEEFVSGSRGGGDSNIEFSLDEMYLTG